MTVQKAFILSKSKKDLKKKKNQKRRMKMGKKKSQAQLYREYPNLAMFVPLKKKRKEIDKEKQNELQTS